MLPRELLEELLEDLIEDLPEALPDTRYASLAVGRASRLVVAFCVLTAIAVTATSADDGADLPVLLPDQVLAMTALIAGDAPRYLAFEAQFREADPSDRTAVKGWVQARFDAAPTAANRLRLAIVTFLTDRAPGSLRRARDELRFLASLDDLMSESEQHAARVYLARVEREVHLQRRIAVLERRGDGLARDLGDAEGDIALLKGQVSMLRRQIEHLTDIERVIDEGNRQPPSFDTGLASERDERGDAESPDVDLPAEDARDTTGDGS